MIKLTDKINVKDCKVETLYNPFATKIISEYNANGNFSDVLLYEQIIEGEITALLLNSFGNIFLFASDGCDRTELYDFLRVISYSSILSNIELDLEFEFIKKHGYIMKYTKTDLNAEYAQTVSVDDVKHLFSLLNKNFSYVNDYEMWYSDILHKIRRNCCEIVAVKKNEKYVSCAVCSSITDTSAVISGICTDNNYMNNGYATDCVKTAVKLLNNREIEDIYILCLGKLTGFYEKNGFQKNGEWYEYIRKI